MRTPTQSSPPSWCFLYQSPRRNLFKLTLPIRRLNIYRACKKHVLLILSYRLFYINILHPDKILTLDECILFNHIHPILKKYLLKLVESRTTGCHLESVLFNDMAYCWLITTYNLAFTKLNLKSTLNTS